METRTRTFPPYLALVIGILCLSMTTIFVRWADSPGTVTAAYRMLISTLALTPFLIKTGYAKPKKATRWIILLIIAGVFIALDHGTMNTAVTMTRIANCTLLNNIAPLWVAIYALIAWREKLGFWFWIGLGITLLGAGTILGTDLLKHPQLSIGDGLAFISSFFYAGYFLITQAARKTMPPLAYIWSVNLISAILLIIYNISVGIPLIGYSPRTYLVFAGAGLISQTIGYFSITYALGHLPASIVSPTMVIQIVLTSLLAIPLTGETLTGIQVAGGITVLAGILLVNLTRKTAPEGSGAVV